MDRIGADIVSQLFAGSMSLNQVESIRIPETYLDEALELQNMRTMVQLADVRIEREQDIAMAKQVSVTFRRALVKQGCMFGFRSCEFGKTDKANLKKQYLSLVFRDRTVTLNVHKLAFADSLPCALRSFVFASIKQAVDYAMAFAGSNVKLVQICIVTVYREMCAKFPSSARWTGDVSYIQQVILGWAEASSHVIGVVFEEVSN